MKVALELAKTIEENANFYYEKAKKAKRKIVGLNKAYLKTQDKIERLKLHMDVEKPKREKKVKRKKDWYEKFRWFYSSEGLLCIGGRDATTNDIIVKKMMGKDDLVFHTEIRGSPFFVIKSEGRKIGKATINEAFEACASFSRAWNLGVTTTEVYYITPEQVKTELGLPKGTFMIYGKRTQQSPDIRLAIGVYEGKPMCGPVDAIRKNCKNLLIITQGDTKKSDAAKMIQKFFSEKGEDAEIDDIVSVLPPGDCKVEKPKA